MFSIAFAIHVTAAAALSIHVLMTGRNCLWLPVLTLVPLLGSALYFFAVLLPELRFERRVRRLVAARRKAAVPPAPWEAARQAFEDVPSLHNRLRLAAALLEAGAVHAAVEHYEACLTGPFAGDPDIRLGAAQAWLRCGHPDKALALLSPARAELPARQAAQESALADQARCEFAAGPRYEAPKAHAA